MAAEAPTYFSPLVVCPFMCAAPLRAYARAAFDSLSTPLPFFCAGIGCEVLLARRSAVSSSSEIWGWKFLLVMKYWAFLRRNLKRKWG